MASTSRPCSLPCTRLPACPTIVDGGNPGICSNGSLRAPSSLSANEPRPEPRISPTDGWIAPNAPRTAATAASSSSDGLHEQGSAGGGGVTDGVGGAHPCRHLGHRRLYAAAAGGLARGR